jgi:tRNA pseudouridine55 synthase
MRCISSISNSPAILLLDKPIDLSSNHALQRVKRLFKVKKLGHTGTLDPLATGMLPICFGAATKFSRFLLNEDKSYSVVAKLGVTTTTGDLEGEVCNRRDVPSLTELAINTLLAEFKGVIKQIPPMYSALKHNGKPLYEYARQGIEIERPARSVNIIQLDLLGYMPATESVSLHVKCSKGTYIRSLIHDIGELIGCGAVVTQLRRTQVGLFSEADMISLDELVAISNKNPAELAKLTLPLSDAFSHLPSIRLSDELLVRLHQGQEVYVEHSTCDLAAVTCKDGHFSGLVSVLEDAQLKVIKLLPRGN